MVSIEAVAGGAGRADDGEPPVRGREHAVDAGDHRVAPSTRSRWLPRHEVPGVFTGLGPDLASEQRGLDLLSPTGVLPGVERGEDPGKQVLPGDVVGDRRPDGARVVPLPACRADEPARSLGAEIGALAVGIGTAAAEGRAHGIDDPRVAFGHVGVPETPALHGARLEVGDDDVGLLDEAQEDLATLWHPEVDRDAALAPVVGAEEGRSTVLPADRAATGSGRRSRGVPP